MNLLVKKALMVVLAITICFAGIWIGSIPFVHPLKETRVDFGTDQTKTIISNESPPLIENPDYLKKRMQYTPPVVEAPPVKNEDELELKPVAPPVVVLPPEISIVNISRSGDHSIVVFKKTSSGEMKSGFVGDVVFQSTIKEIDFRDRRVLVMHKKTDFWIPLLTDAVDD